MKHTSLKFPIFHIPFISTQILAIFFQLFIRCSSKTHTHTLTHIHTHLSQGITNEGNMVAQITVGNGGKYLYHGRSKVGRSKHTLIPKTMTSLMQMMS